MSKIKNDKISAKGLDIQVYTEDFKNDYISLTDIARYKNTDDPRFVIQNWMRNRNTLEFIGLWEVLNNINFNRVQFDTFRNEAGLNRFTKNLNYDTKNDTQNVTQNVTQSEGQNEGENEGQNDGKKLKPKDRRNKIVKLMKENSNITTI